MQLTHELIPVLTVVAEVCVC